MMSFNTSYSKYAKGLLVTALLMGSFYPIWSQEKNLSEAFVFREDQFYVGASFMLLQSNKDDFRPQGLSRHFQWGFVRDIPLNSSGKMATGIGLGMSFEKYNTNLNRSTGDVGQVYYAINDTSSSPFYFSVHSLELPLTLRWRNATPEEFAFWRVYGGVSLRWNYFKKIQNETFELKKNNEIENFGTVAHLSFGYNTWNFYLAYHLSPFFDKTLLNSNSPTLRINTLKIGLIFYIL